MATDNMGIRVNRSRTLEEIGQLRLKRIDKALTRFIIIVVETNLRILHPCFSFERRKKMTSISERFSCEIYVRGDTLRAVFFFFFLLFFKRHHTRVYSEIEFQSCLQRRNDHSSRSKNARAELRFSWKICIVRPSIHPFELS